MNQALLLLCLLGPPPSSPAVTPASASLETPLATQTSSLAAASSTARLGINLATHTSSSSHVLFGDAIMRAEPWTPFTPRSQVWDSQASVPLDAVGMPTHVPFVPDTGGPPQRVRTRFLNHLQGQYPAGTYIVSFMGSGEIVIDGDPGRHRWTQSGNHPIHVVPGDQGWVIEIHRSEPSEPIRDLHVWFPGQQSSSPTIHRLATDRLRGFEVLRIKQTMGREPNQYPCHNRVQPSDPACIHDWLDRTTPDHFSQNRPAGIALEHAVDLANQAGSDLWPGIPHAANDEWIRKAARLILERLHPRRSLYIELSTDVWRPHPQHPQHQYFREVGKRDQLFSRDLPGDEFEAGRRAYLRRAFQVFSIFHEVFGDAHSHRLINVLPTLFGWPSVAERLLSHINDPELNPQGMVVDALAVGAYFGQETITNLLEEEGAPPISTEALLGRLTQTLGTLSDDPLVETFSGLTKAHAKLAHAHQLELIAYEGGLGLMTGPNEWPERLGNLIVEANRHPRMRELYAKMFSLWDAAGGRLFAASTFMELSSRQAAFGHLEHLFQPIEEAPKFAALRQRLESSGRRLPPALRIAHRKTYIARWGSGVAARAATSTFTSTSPLPRATTAGSPLAAPKPPTPIIEPVVAATTSTLSSRPQAPLFDPAVETSSTPDQR